MTAVLTVLNLYIQYSLWIMSLCKARDVHGLLLVVPLVPGLKHFAFVQHRFVTVIAYESCEVVYAKIDGAFIDRQKGRGSFCDMIGLIC